MVLVVPPQFHYLGNSLFCLTFYFDHGYFLAMANCNLCPIMFLKMAKSITAHSKQSKMISKSTDKLSHFITICFLK